MLIELSTFHQFITKFIFFPQLKFFSFLMTQSGIHEGTRLTVFQHLLRNLQQSPTGSFSTKDIKRKKHQSASTQKHLCSQQKMKQQINLSWTDASGWPLSLAGFSRPQERILETTSSSIPRCHSLDSEFYGEDSCVPIVILLAIRAFLIRLIEIKLLLQSSCGNGFSILPDSASTEKSPSHGLYHKTYEIPYQPQSPGISPVSCGSSVSHALSPSPKPFSPHLYQSQLSECCISSLTALEFESLHNILREGCTANSSTTRLLSAECIGILGAVAYLSVNLQELNTVSQIIARWAETYSILVGCSIR